jgi:HK97 family phage prohead protease
VKKQTDTFFSPSRPPFSEKREGITFKIYQPEIKAIDVERRTIRHLITTDTPDRDGDIIEPEGWNLSEFLKNPVVLFAHRHDEPPIARSLEIQKAAHGLEALTQFPPKGVNSLADTAFELNRLGYLRSWSVGFVPKKTRMRFDQDGKFLGTAYEEQTLLEYSSVPIPANSDAVNLAISKGLVTEEDLERLGWNRDPEASAAGRKKPATELRKALLHESTVFSIELQGQQLASRLRSEIGLIRQVGAEDSRCRPQAASERKLRYALGARRNIQGE